jgi:hypothetical protein
MDHRSEAPAEPAADLAQGITHIVIGGQIDQNRLDTLQRPPGLNRVEPDHPVVPRQARGHGLPQEAA